MCLRFTYLKRAYEFFSNLPEITESALDTADNAHIMLVDIEERLCVLDDVKKRIELIDNRLDGIEKWHSQHEILVMS